MVYGANFMVHVVLKVVGIHDDYCTRDSLYYAPASCVLVGNIMQGPLGA